MSRETERRSNVYERTKIVPHGFDALRKPFYRLTWAFSALKENLMSLRILSQKGSGKNLGPQSSSSGARTVLYQEQCSIQALTTCQPGVRTLVPGTKQTQIRSTPLKHSTNSDLDAAGILYYQFFVIACIQFLFVREFVLVQRRRTIQGGSYPPFESR
ncbi:hypothetical protein B0H13DRAFT_2260967 [Mycena leptocephala]|nr:hypothetical protein B0H13DRAFT_2260967 [Mycena leptocephala]